MLNNAPARADVQLSGMTVLGIWRCKNVNEIDTFAKLYNVAFSILILEHED